MLKWSHYSRFQSFEIAKLFFLVAAYLFLKSRRQKFRHFELLEEFLLNRYALFLCGIEPDYFDCLQFYRKKAPK